MRVICSDEAVEIRNRFVRSFLDLSSDYYRDQIEKADANRCHQGYYWDCMKDKQLISEADIHLALAPSNNMMYLLCDLHGEKRYFCGNRFEYPFGAVLELSYAEFKKIEGTLPEDFYIIDKEFKRCFSLTHEWIDDDRFCLESRRAER